MTRQISFVNMNYSTYIKYFHILSTELYRRWALPKKAYIWGLNTSDLGWSAYTKRCKQRNKI